MNQKVVIAILAKNPDMTQPRMFIEYWHILIPNFIVSIVSALKMVDVFN